MGLSWTWIVQRDWFCKSQEGQCLGYCSFERLTARGGFVYVHAVHYVKQFSNEILGLKEKQQTSPKKASSTKSDV